ncbi:response regulator [Siansivirga zeaxanthinifaciens]|uniref:Transcriptional regulator n=1 Tax=Siansivirga zeaxanthinifaciens CC-SAMT-1 TaxID=1454006 RepID=A0A0C5VYB9_9FLAO|nr:response regulator [Siansivirga zeaxanthinifaciens]AJR04081.1 transcriptional regulator [Siansivirga zeaxanthinifaciens CC-SAMT-1]
MKKTLNILLIEDDIIELMKLNRVVTSLNYNHKIIEASNGEYALEILKKSGKKPDIILLDLNMPKLGGIEFLSILKNNDDLRSIPAIVLTTSNNPKDILECRKLGIAGYILKPLKYEDYVSKIKKTFEYWSINEIVE